MVPMKNRSVQTLLINSVQRLLVNSAQRLLALAPHSFVPVTQRRDSCQVDILCLWYTSFNFGRETCAPAILSLASDAAEERGLPRATWSEDRHRLACQPKSYPEAGYFTVSQNLSTQFNCPDSQRLKSTIGWKPAPRQVTAEGKQST